MFSFLPKSKDLQQLAAKAEAAAKIGRAGEAEKLLRQMILLETEIEKSQAAEDEKQAGRKILAQAFLDLGEICEKKSAHGEALAHYGKARFLGATLTPAAWARLAETYAAEGSTSDSALGAYFAYIQQRPLDASSAKVYAALESVSRVDEHTVSDARKRASEIAKRVIAANSALEWPYYYLAVAYLQDGELPAAMINLARAQKRNPNRAMTYYWMGACLLREAEGSLEDAVEWFSKFFAFPPDDPHIAELQASAALELGKRLAVQSGGSRRALQEAVPYLELALSRGAAIEGVELSDAHELLARFSAAAGRYAEAETHSRAALSWKGRQAGDPRLLTASFVRSGEAGRGYQGVGTRSTATSVARSGRGNLLRCARLFQAREICISARVAGPASPGTARHLLRGLRIGEPGALGRSAVEISETRRKRG